MSLKIKIDADIKTAMLAKEKDVLRALRSIKSLILLEESKEGATGTIAEADEIKMLTKAAKQRRDSLTIFKTQGRDDLAAAEEAELEVIERYLPKQLSPEELSAKIDSIIAETGAKSSADMGKTIGAANKALAGLADGKAIADLVKAKLASMS